MKERFEAFLIENDALDNFKEAFREGSIRETLEEYIKMVPEDSIISGAFVWYISPQGSHYWTKLNIKWVEGLEAEKNKKWDEELTRIHGKEEE